MIQKRINLTDFSPVGVFLGLLLTVLISLPSVASAYFTTSQKALPLEDGSSALFLIEYRFGTNKHDVHMPILTEVGTERKTGFVSYEIIDGNGNPVRGTMKGIVLSSTPIKERMYVIPKGLGKNFTLVVVFTPEPAVPTVSSLPKSYRLQVTQLPFSFNGTQELQLNPSELKYYTTELIELR